MTTFSIWSGKVEELSHQEVTATIPSMWYMFEWSSSRTKDIASSGSLEMSERTNTRFLFWSWDWLQAAVARVAVSARDKSHEAARRIYVGNLMVLFIRVLYKKFQDYELIESWA